MFRQGKEGTYHFEVVKLKMYLGVTLLVNISLPYVHIIIYIYVYKCECVCVCVSKLQEYWWSMIFDDDLPLLKPLKQEEGLVEHL